MSFSKKNISNSPKKSLGTQTQLDGGSTHLNNISQIGNLPQVGVKIKNV